MALTSMRQPAWRVFIAALVFVALQAVHVSAASRVARMTVTNENDLRSQHLTLLYRTNQVQYDVVVSALCDYNAADVLSQQPR